MTKLGKHFVLEQGGIIGHEIKFPVRLAQVALPTDTPKKLCRVKFHSTHWHKQSQLFKLVQELLPTSDVVQVWARRKATVERRNSGHLMFMSQIQRNLTDKTFFHLVQALK